MIVGDPVIVKVAGKDAVAELTAVLLPGDT